MAESSVKQLVLLLCEEVRTGVIFMETSGRGYLMPHGIFSPNTRLKLACADFIRAWAVFMPLDARADLQQHRPEELVNQLINEQGLVLFVKPAGAVREAVEPAHYEVDGLDGHFSYTDMLNLIMSGKVTSNSFVDDGTEWNEAIKFPEFQRVFADEPGQHHPATTLATPPPEDLRPDVPGKIFPYYSATELPRLSSDQVGHLVTTFGITVEADTFYWRQSLVSTRGAEVPATTLFRVKQSARATKKI